MAGLVTHLSTFRFVIFELRCYQLSRKFTEQLYITDKNQAKYFKDWPMPDWQPDMFIARIKYKPLI
jgi:hypothetical protein